MRLCCTMIILLCVTACGIRGDLVRPQNIPPQQDERSTDR